MEEQTDFFAKLDHREEPAPDSDQPPLMTEDDFQPPINEPEKPIIRKLSDKNILDLIAKFRAGPDAKKFERAGTMAFYILENVSHTDDDLSRTIEILNGAPVKMEETKEEKEEELKYYWQKGPLA